MFYCDIDEQTLAEEVDLLKDKIETHPDVEFYFNPNSALLYTDNYVFNFPLSAKYRIGILINPCRLNALNRHGSIRMYSEHPSILLFYNLMLHYIIL